MRRLVFFLILGIVSAQLLAQSGRIRGVVLDASSGEPLFGANVSLEEVSIGTSTNRFGRFSVENLKAGTYEVKVSYIGFEEMLTTIEVNAESETELEIKLVTKYLSLGDFEVSQSIEQNVATISSFDIRLKPKNTSQDVLKIVPGLFIAQHAGGGKAEQIFLRGFDIDHGTDIALTVDGMPVNMVSHAHGQGYSDLHFVIPETIDRVDFDKGPYYANKGNLNTAGFADFKLKNRLHSNSFKVEGGQFNTFRGVAMLNLLNGQTGDYDPSLYLATEYVISDGYFESPQNFNRFNALLKYNHRLNDRRTLDLSTSAFTSRWSASGQIPVRAVESGQISRFGAIDDTEGGNTSRYNFNAKLTSDFKNGSFLENHFFVSQYDFNLVSNFTFFLNDPLNGDQITQSENRTILGSKHSYWSDWSLFGLQASTEVGVGLRKDLIRDNRLSKTFQKTTILEDLAFGDIKEDNLYLYAEENVSLTDRLNLTAGLRYDYFNFNYQDALTSEESSTSQSIVSPKLKLSYQASSDLNVYLKSGSGFHSNDARVATARNGRETLPKAYGLDVGTIWKPTDKLLLNLAFWRLDLEQEFVYVGDEGIVEAGGRTKRQGIDLGLRYQINPYIYATFDINYTDPKAIDEPEGQHYIPLAPTFTSIGRLNIDTQKRFRGSIGYRYLGDRAANENYSLTADGYFLMDLNLSYQLKAFDLGLSIENIFNTEWKEAQFETESRLRNEVESTSEIHFTPGTPFFAKMSIGITF